MNDRLIGIGLVLFGIILFYLTVRFPVKDRVLTAFLPTQKGIFASIVSIIIGILLILGNKFK